MSEPVPSGDRRPALPPAVWIIAGVTLVSSVVAAMLGEGPEWSARLVTLVSVWINAGWPAAAFLLGAVGIGTLCGRWTRGVEGGPLINAGLGLAATLTVTHLLGVAGWLNPVTAWAWMGTGLVLLAVSARRSTTTDRSDGGLLRDPWCVGVLIVAASGLGIMLTASSLAPGILWASEFGGYDTLSYHLQLPAEWLADGRIAPMEHNVYSFLPGYVEAGAVHMAHLAGAPGRARDGLNGLLVGSGDLAMSAHFLSVGLAVIGSWGAGVLTRTFAGACGLESGDRDRAACLAAALVLVTPWVQVVGTMAYNETGVIALGSAALGAAVAGGIGPIKRGVLVAALMGAACGCKPTAILFLTPVCAALMMWRTPRRGWFSMYAIGAIVGLLMLSPWMLRNTAAGGNPVFPQGAAVFGTAHWSDEQAERYKGGHSFDGSVMERAFMLARPDPSADADSPAVARFRGLSNPQWALTPWLGIAGIGLLMVPRGSRPAGLALGVGVGLGLVAWMFATHLQSRFLVVMVPLFACGFGVGVARMGSNGLLRSVAWLMLIGSMLWSLRNFAEQRDGDPNRLLAAGTALLSGRIDAGGVSDELVWSWINRNAPDGTLLLVGDAAPFYYRRPVVYATTWDTHPLAIAMRAHPDDPGAWTRSLREGGADWVLISFGELDRLARSGWGDPLISPDRVAAWADTLGAPVRVWSGGSTALFRIGE